MNLSLGIDHLEIRLCLQVYLSSYPACPIKKIDTYNFPAFGTLLIYNFNCFPSILSLATLAARYSDAI